MTDLGAGRGRAVGPLVGVLAGLVALGPVLLHRGFTLSYDLVAVPDPPITASTWGMDGSLPRAVPNDLVVALLGHVLPSDLVEKLLLLAVFVVGAWGASHFMTTLAGRSTAALLYVWNPYVLERLVIGHVGFLLGLAVLPWAVHAALGLREGAAGASSRTALWVVVAALAGATSGVLVAACALVASCWPGGRGRWYARAWPVAVPALLAGSVWLLPALLRPGGIPADPAGVGAFAARADTPIGLLPSLLTLGGIWNPATWPGERRNGVLALAVLLAVLAGLVLGVRSLLRSRSGGGSALVATGAAALLMAVAASTPGLRSVFRWVVDDLPGGGLVRDSHKLLMPAVLVVALATAYAAERLAARPGLVSVAVALAAAPVVLLPSLGWGAHGRLTSVEYPAEWVQVQRLVADQPGGGDVASFPWTYYRRLPWDGERVVLDPMPRLLPRVVVVNDDLPLKTVRVHGEDARAAAVTAALASDRPLAAALRQQGIGLAVVDLRAAGAAAIRSRLAGSRVLHDGPDLLLVDLGPAVPPHGRPPAVAALGWVLMALALGGASSARVMSAIGRPLLPWRQT